MAKSKSQDTGKKTKEEKKILDAKWIQRSISRLARQVVEDNNGAENLVVVGIRTRGVFLAERIVKEIKDIEGVEVPMGILDITLYRDDLDSHIHQPVVRGTDINFDFTDKVIILVDDILFTGRTIRAAMDELIDFGRPKMIKLLVLVDRGHRELPIKADYCGKEVETAQGEVLKLRLKELDKIEDEVVVYKKGK